MHFNNTTSHPALPLTCGTVQCCKPFQPFSAAVALKDLHTEELERKWIYDTGAVICLIGYNLLTANEKRRIFKIAPRKVTTACGVHTRTDAVMCNVLYIGERFVYVMEDPPLLSV